MHMLKTDIMRFPHTHNHSLRIYLLAVNKDTAKAGDNDKKLTEGEFQFVCAVIDFLPYCV